MQTQDHHILKLALKLLELFSHQIPNRYGFERYWPLVGPVQSFSEHAHGRLEQDLAKALQIALEDVLQRTAPKSFHMDAPTVAAYLNAPPDVRPYKQSNRYRNNIKRKQ